MNQNSSDKGNNKNDVFNLTAADFFLAVEKINDNQSLSYQHFTCQNDMNTVVSDDLALTVICLHYT